RRPCHRAVARSAMRFRGCNRGRCAFTPATRSCSPAMEFVTDSRPRSFRLVPLSRSRTRSCRVGQRVPTMPGPWSPGMPPSRPKPKTGYGCEDSHVVMNRPDPQRVQLEHEYSTALRDCVSGAGEVALSHAYELGRVAAGTGIGVVELAAIHDAALRNVLGTSA